MYCYGCTVNIFYLTSSTENSFKPLIENKHVTPLSIYFMLSKAKPYAIERDNKKLITLGDKVTTHPDL